MRSIPRSLTLAALLAFALPVHDAEAKRLGGGGVKRNVPTQTTPQSPAPSPQQAAPAKQAAATPAAAAAAAPKRSWMGPIAGLAAGLGLAALASHLGFDGELSTALTGEFDGAATPDTHDEVSDRLGLRRPNE